MNEYILLTWLSISGFFNEVNRCQERMSKRHHSAHPMAVLGNDDNLTQQGKKDEKKWIEI